LAQHCAELLDEKKLQDITIFEVGPAIQITEYFVIASGLNARHVQNVSGFLSKSLREDGVSRGGLEGYHEGKWILLDYDSVVVHLFLVENRDYYDLELLWGDCPRVEWTPSERPAARENAS
jgi:ribosome-associated protein